MQRRGRQQARIQFAGEADLRADHPGGLGFELRPELVPIDEIRADQRGHQRNDKGNRQSEQRRLHGVSLWARPGAMAARNGPPAAR